MADKGIKKVIISKDDLPAVGPINNHIVRYRIVSEDKNRTSHWSPVYNLIGHAPVSVPGAIEVGSKSITIVWEDSEEFDDREAYDIFTKIDDGVWEFKGTSFVHGFTMIKPNSGSQIAVAIQIESYVKERNATLTIFEDTEPLV